MFQTETHSSCDELEINFVMIHIIIFIIVVVINGIKEASHCFNSK